MRSEGNSRKWKTNGWYLLHDNAPAHRSVLVKDFLAKNNVTTLQHSPYSSPVPWTVISILWCYRDNSECEERTEKSFTKWLPGMFPTS
jgi:hypothetical protein